MINAPIVTALNSSTFVAIKIGATNNKSRSISFFTDDGTAFLIATSVAGANVATVPANLPVNYGDLVDPDNTVVWVKASAGTPNLVVLVGGKK